MRTPSTIGDAVRKSLEFPCREMDARTGRRLTAGEQVSPLAWGR